VGKDREDARQWENYAHKLDAPSEELEGLGPVLKGYEIWFRNFQVSFRQSIRFWFLIRGLVGVSIFLLEA